uniref:Transposase n=1 Tax=Parastrongyloides trichosuri TaxID=131310 RepID=A0A0N4ZW55_PARTI
MDGFRSFLPRHAQTLRLPVGRDHDHAFRLADLLSQRAPGVREGTAQGVHGRAVTKEECGLAHDLNREVSWALRLRGEGSVKNPPGRWGRCADRTPARPEPARLATAESDARPPWPAVRCSGRSIHSGHRPDKRRRPARRPPSACRSAG